MKAFRSVTLPALAVLLVFGSAFTAIAAAVSHSERVARVVRLAQTARARVLDLQLDQEASVRGYVDTRQALFLQPYAADSRQFDAAVAQARAVIGELAAPNALRLIAQQASIHRAWIAYIARPLIADPRRRNQLALQLHGRALMARFRADNALLSDALEKAAGDSNRYGRRLVTWIIAGGLVFGILLQALVQWLLQRQHALAGEVERRTMLYHREREIARALEEAVIPRKLPRVPGIRLYAQYHAATQPERVGGDWYDIFALPNGRVFIAVGDVTGHGISAFVNMTRLRRAIVASALQESEPGAILTAANRFMLATRGPGVPLGTVICAFVDPAANRVSFATAGHPPPILALSTGARMLSCSGLPMGLQETSYETYTADASQGALLAFYTDGLTEYSRDLLAGEARLLEAAALAAGDRARDPAEAMTRRIMHGDAPHDDVALVAVAFE
jgi:serine phosphatase RsbU (regulator of sigma subunit)